MQTVGQLRGQVGSHALLGEMGQHGHAQRAAQQVGQPPHRRPVNVARPARAGEHHALRQAAAAHPPLFGTRGDVQHDDLFAQAAVVVDQQFTGLCVQQHMAGAAEVGLAPQRLQRVIVRIEAPGGQVAIGAVVAHHDAALQIHQWRVVDAAAGQAAHGDGAVVARVAHRHPDQPVRTAADAGSHHGDAVAVASVVHEPGVAAVQHHVPAVTLRRAGGVVELPIGIALQPCRLVVPVVAQDGTYAHHVDRIADGAEPCNRWLRANRGRAGRQQVVRIEHTQTGVVRVRQVLGDDQAVVQHHEGVVGLRDRQLPAGAQFAVAAQPMRMAAIDNVDVAVAVNRHAARPHRSAGQARRALQRAQRRRLNLFHTGGGRQSDVRAQCRMGQQVDLARCAQHSHRRQQGVACHAGQAFVGAQRQRRSLWGCL